MLLLFLTRADLLPRLVSGGIKRRKDARTSFLVEFGDTSCATCELADQQLSEQLKQNKLDIYYYDCSEEQNKLTCKLNNVTRFPSFVLFNPDQVKNKPMFYRSHDNTGMSIYKWALQQAKKPFAVVGSVVYLTEETLKDEQFVLILTKEKHIDTWIYEISKIIKNVKVLVKFQLEDKDIIRQNIRELIKDTENNVIKCKNNTCERYEDDKDIDVKELAKWAKN
ncbi:Protein_disulfide isomerase [Hexamita inflata]|uniref:Protein disulfide isomerase n=1 Tax=Hexamita inflata TaxID=28002 RepID=A0AA86VJ10_9EUKA|nr:Protein disulfide isomerase [Hexamita inflata]